MTRSQPTLLPSQGLLVASVQVTSPETQPEHVAFHPWGLDPGTPCRDGAQARMNVVVPAENAGNQAPGTATSRVTTQAVRRS